MNDSEEYIKGRGAQIFTKNPYHKNEVVQEHFEGLDEPLIDEIHTQVFYESPKKVLNKVTSPDTGMMYSINPYQGCEHGCIYCYARNSHQYWGFSAGLDFESKIVVKENAPELLEAALLKKSWQAHPIALSGNTDCYQPLERKLRITRKLLEVFLKYKHPVGVITKNALILRDLDILRPLAQQKLVHVFVTITSLSEDLRQKMEPRTVSYKKRLKVVEALSRAGVPVGVMVAPIIPGLNSKEIPEVIKQAAEHGALQAGYTVIRLNGSIKELFHDWLYKNYPDAAQKVWNQIKNCHGGQVNDSRYGTRMTGEGAIADTIKQLFNVSVARYMKQEMPAYDLSLFKRPGENYQLF